MQMPSVTGVSAKHPIKALSIVVPCYNEQEVLPETARQLGGLLDNLIASQLVTADSAIYFVDDGSNDNTWSLIEDLAKNSSKFHGIKLAHNRGHQNAMLAGILTAPGDILVSIDADLQDDVNTIRTMIQRHYAGAELVYGVRSRRDVDTFFKRNTADAYYRLLRLFGVDIISHHADFRLMSRCAIDALKQYTEVNLFVRGIVPQLGFNTAIVAYERKARFAGESKYPLRKMVGLAVNGITSFTTVPLRFITFTGVALSFLSIMVGIWAIALRLFTDRAVPGWASTVVPMYLLGGVQLLSIGIIGEYLGKTYMETKHRPRYIIEKMI
jgi:polyisoprenyl-phosphate glycosyltransferase